MGELEKDNLLRSWKEIAAYLGVDVRTCYRWEDDRGMPVHRASIAEKKSPVFAYKDELDAWFKEAFQSTRGNGEARKRRRKGWVLAAASLVVLAGVLSYVFFLRTPRQPVDFRIEGPVFIALDKYKRELWRKDTKAENLRPEQFYRDNFQFPRRSTPNILPILVIRDINGDRDNEVLFALVRERDQTGEGIIFCWDRHGRELWNFPAGRLLRCPKKVFSPDYRIAGFYCRDIDGDGKLETFVEAFQAPDWPCQLALLDSSGKKIGEFWNAGYLKDLTFHDINGDGREELIICGVNNEYRGGCLIIFDPKNISGGSPQTDDFVCEGIGPGSMLYYVRTPYVDVSEAQHNPVEGLRTLEITKNGWIEATANNGLIYDFDFGLDCVQASWGNSFIMAHYELSRSGAVTSTLEGDSYRQMLLKGILYWTGSAWTPEPSPVMR